ncbi:hypothetical protein OF83DRAFT_1129942 [Amylostereum chailletii]|nr:hypothetical protein OF83DRAFT_1129942 [Amylostereum chailletii]
MTSSPSRDPRLAHAFYKHILESKQNGSNRVTSPAASPNLLDDDASLDLEYPDSPEDVEMAEAAVAGPDSTKTEERMPCQSNERDQHAPTPVQPRQPLVTSPTSMSSSTSAPLPPPSRNAPSPPVLLPHRTQVPLKSALVKPLPPRPTSAAGHSVTRPHTAPRPRRRTAEELRSDALNAPLYKASATPAQGAGLPMPQPVYPAAPARPTALTGRYQPYPPHATPNAHAGPSNTGPDRNIGPKASSKVPPPSSASKSTPASKPVLAIKTYGSSSASRRVPGSPTLDVSSLSLQESQGRPRSPRGQPPPASSSSSHQPPPRSPTARPAPSSSRAPPKPGPSRPRTQPASSGASPTSVAAPAAAPSSSSAARSRGRRRLPIAPTALTRSSSPTTRGFSGTTPSFSVTLNRMSVLASDGDPARVPAPGTHHDTHGKPFHFERVLPTSADASLRRGLAHWQKTIGRYVAAVMFGRKQTANDPPWILERWPEGYTFWVAIKPKTDGKDGKPRAPRKDYYLYGGPTSAFASPMEFVSHAIWLMSGRAGACECKYCSREDQQPITDRLERILEECGDGTVYGQGE